MFQKIILSSDKRYVLIVIVNVGIITGLAGLTRWHWIGLCLLFTSCSVLSKEQGLTVMAVCVVYDFFLLQKVVK